MQKTDGVLIIFDVTNVDSFKMIYKYVDLITGFKNKIPIVIAGNKID